MGASRGQNSFLRGQNTQICQNGRFLPFIPFLKGVGKSLQPPPPLELLLKIANFQNFSWFQFYVYKLWLCLHVELPGQRKLVLYNMLRLTLKEALGLLWNIRSDSIWYENLLGQAWFGCLKLAENWYWDHFKFDRSCQVFVCLIFFKGMVSFI